MHTPFSIISLDDFKKDRDRFSEELGINFRKWGFCGVKNHGVDTSLVKEVQNLFIDFFNLTEEKKLEYFDSELGGARGYTPFKIETPKDAHKPDPSRRDRVIMSKSADATVHAGLRQAPNKSLREAYSATVAGGHVDGDIGTVCAPRPDDIK